MLEQVRDGLAPQHGYIYEENERLRADQKKLSFLVGLMAFLLPSILLFARVVYGRVEPSISHYYYDTLFLGDIFVGILIFIGALLLTYRGRGKWIARLATLAGLAAILVAVFPTEGWVCPQDTDLTRRPIFLACEAGRLEVETSQIVHFSAAAILFVILALFCLFVFTALHAKDGRVMNEDSRNKRRRNRIYRFCGWVIITCILAIAANAVFDIEGWEEYSMTYVAEAVALFAFGIAWMTNGRFLFGFLTDPHEAPYWPASGNPQT